MPTNPQSPIAALRECPFCGGPASMRGDQWCGWAQCEACEAEGPTRDGVSEAVDAWNGRSPRILAALELAERVDEEEDAYVISRMGNLLAEIAVIVNGPEPALTRWSYHDLPQKVARLRQAAYRAPCCGVSEGEVHSDDCATAVANEMDAWAERRLSGPPHAD